MGDAAYELMIRERIVRKGNSQVNRLHLAAVHLVKAGTQAALIRFLEPVLTPAELAVYRRGRNAHSHTTAKNASVIEYRMATGFEALAGYLWLSGQKERLEELVETALSKLEEEEKRQQMAAEGLK
ncbi:MAG: ribonuclease III [Stomatobaculum sp.]|nr:ribonuclease III [Stomatobaculum sp.]